MDSGQILQSYVFLFLLRCLFYRKATSWSVRSTGLDPSATKWCDPKIPDCLHLSHMYKLMTDSHFFALSVRQCLDVSQILI